MPRLPRFLLVALLLGAAAAPARAQDAAVAVNPVIDELGVADPHVLKYNGEYYLYVTGDPIRAFHSTDLVHWNEIGGVLSGSRDADAWNQADVWAPEVVYDNGRFYLYYTASRASSDWRVGEMARRIGVGVSDSPRGPFEDLGTPLTPGWGIDGHVFTDPDTGDDYFFYSYLYEPRLPGAGLVLDRMRGPTALEGTPSHVTRGSEAWEDKDGDPTDGSLRYTNEAPTVLKRDGRYYLLYSGGSWDLPTYALAYATTDTLRDDGLDGAGWTKAVPPILRSTPLVEAPGHNSVVKAPNNVDDVTAYHARVVPYAGPGDRQTFVDRLYWLHGRPYLNPPSLAVQAPPDQPRFRALFDADADALGDGWDAVEGTWRQADGHAVQPRRATAFAAPAVAPLHHYVFEANLRMPEPDRRGAAGVAAYWTDAGDRVDVWLDPARRALVTTGTVGGAALPETTTPLPDDFRYDVFHQLLVTKNAGRLGIALDGVRMQAHTLALGAGRAGLRTRDARAAFDGVALTPFYEDFFRTPGAAGWTADDGWMVDEGALHQVAGGTARTTALKGDPADAYEFTASVRYRDQESTASTAGIVAAAGADGALVLAGFDRTIWPYARLHVRYVDAGGAERGAFRVALPRGFQYDAYHTLRAVKQGDAFTFYLDGREVAAARFPVGPARPGLYTEGVRAAFDEARMKHLGVPRNLLLDGGFEALPRTDAVGDARTPWRLAGAASVNTCCAHTGLQRLTVTGADGRAVQTLDGLAPGAYTLYAFATTRDAVAEVRVEAGGTAAQASTDRAAWTPLRIDVDVPAGGGPVTVTLGARPGGPGAFAAFDDLFLVRR